MTLELEALPKQEELATWLAEFDFGGKSELPSLRVEAVGTFASSISVSDIEELVRMAFRTREKPASEFIERFRLGLRTNNTEFPAYGNDREMEVLAGMTLYSVMASSKDDMSAICALSISSASIDGVRSHSMPFDLTGYAEYFLTQISELNSQRPNLIRLGDKHTAAIQAIEAIPDPAPSSATIKAAMTAIVKAAQSGTTQINNMFSAAGKFMKQQDEELQILWWLLGDRAVKFNCDFSDIPEVAKPLVLAAELADHIEILPGPISTESLLSRAGLNDGKKVEVSTVLDSIQEDWLNKLVSNVTISPILQPIHFAIKRQLENGKGKEWVKSWANLVGLAEDLSFSPLSLAKQVYRERLILKANGAGSKK
jgi:ferritin